MKLLKKYRYNILSFIMPLIIFTTALIFKGVFINKLFTTSDSFSQYLPTYQYLYNVLHGMDTFPYTFSKGLGGTMYGAFFYGLSTPFNLLLYFFDDIHLFIAISTILKISLSGLTMYVFLKKENKNPEIINLIFSLAYAISGYSTLYYINIMWMDAVWLAPLILIGINKVIQEKKDFTYIITLLLALVSNYYTGYMLVLFSIIYFFYKLYLSYNGNHFFKENKKRIIHFIFLTFLICCSVLFIFLPIILESTDYIRINNNNHILNFNIFDIFAGTYIGFGKLDNPLNNNGLLIYCGTCSIPLLIYYFTSKSISKKEKIASIILLTLLLLPVFIRPLSFIWHLFTYPQGFNYRYSFIIIIFILLLSSKSLVKMDGINKYVKIYFCIYLIISSSLIYTTYNNPDFYIYLNYKKILLSLAFCLVNCLLITKNKKNQILIILLIELIININVISYQSNFIDSKLVDEYINYNTDAMKLYDDDYRYETTVQLNINNSLYFNYNGISIFLSSNNKRCILFPYELYGITKKYNFFNYGHYNMISDSLLGVKYISDNNLNPKYDLVKEFNIDGNKAYFQKNNYALSLGYMASKNVKNYKKNKTGINNLNDLLNSIDGRNNNYFIKLNVEKINDTKFIIKKDKQYPQLYILSESKPKNIDYSLLSIGDEYSILYDKSTSDIELEFDEPLDKLEIVSLDTDKLMEFKERRNELFVEKKSNNYILSSIDVKENGVLMTTIPYEKGWEIYVDGNKTTYYEILNSFIAIDLEKGKHKIEFYYNIPGIKLGIGCSIVSLAILIAYEIRKKSTTKILV